MFAPALGVSSWPLYVLQSPLVVVGSIPTCISAGVSFVALMYGLTLQGYFHQRFTNGRGTGPGTAAHWEAQPPVVAQGAAAALRTRPLPQPTASSLVVESFCHQRAVHSPWQPRRPTVAKDAAGVLAV